MVSALSPCRATHMTLTVDVGALSLSAAPVATQGEPAAYAAAGWNYIDADILHASRDRPRLSERAASRWVPRSCRPGGWLDVLREVAAVTTVEMWKMPGRAPCARRGAIAEICTDTCCLDRAWTEVAAALEVAPAGGAQGARVPVLLGTSFFRPCAREVDRIAS